MKLNALRVVGMTGRKDEIANAFPIDFGFIKAKGCDIEPRFEGGIGMESLPKAIDGIAFAFMDAIIPSDPTSRKILFFQ